MSGLSSSLSATLRIAICCHQFNLADSSETHYVASFEGSDALQQLSFTSMLLEQLDLPTAENHHAPELILVAFDSVTASVP
ncbi:hypothetical protein DL96DRAFT_1713331 [Flagelloscypha sp. PMI_526]|nr:hypothetical protein DL96DRAFT_1713331 [Flagelloscypha sp. PMI_526]